MRDRVYHWKMYVERSRKRDEDCEINQKLSEKERRREERRLRPTGGSKKGKNEAQRGPSFLPFPSPLLSICEFIDDSLLLESKRERVSQSDTHWKFSVIFQLSKRCFFAPGRDGGTWD